MDKKLDCAIIRDLLPSYVDGLSSDITNQAIEEHVADCSDCAEALRLMREPEAEREPPAAEVDYLKKVRRSSTGRALIIGIVLMLLGMTLLSFRIFYVGSAANAGDVSCHITAEGNSVTVSGALTGSGLGVSRVTFSDSGGTVRVKVYTAPKIFWNSGDFSKHYTAGSDVRQVCIDDLILWENGKTISNTAARLFQATNPFVGDMPSNGKIAAILGVSDQFGPYTNELQTASEPYGWTLCLETGIAQNEERAAQNIMAADSYVMLATVGNLGYVTWKYQVDGGDRKYTVTSEEAAAYVDRDIKECARSASDLQSLLESLSIKWAGVRETVQKNGTFNLKINNHSDDNLYGLEMNFYLDGKLLGTRATVNADGSALKRDDEITFDFVPDDFPADTSTISLSQFSFDLSASDRAGKKTVVCEKVPVPAKYTWNYSFSLTGDFDTGFTLTEE